MNENHYAREIRAHGGGESQTGGPAARFFFFHKRHLNRCGCAVCVCVRVRVEEKTYADAYGVEVLVVVVVSRPGWMFGPMNTVNGHRARTCFRTSITIYNIVYCKSSPPYQ